MLSYFDLRGGARGVPRRRDVELMDVYALVPNVVMIDLEGELHGEHRFRWRLAGTNVRHFTGVELTGKYLDDVAEPATAASADSVYCRVLKDRRAHVWHHRVHVKGEGREFVEYDRLILPMLDDAEEARYLLGIYKFGEKGRG